MYDKKNYFIGKPRVIVKARGDSIGYDFNKFVIWKNSDNKYYIRRADGCFWGKHGWSRHVFGIRIQDNTEECLIYMYHSLKRALGKAKELFDIRSYEEVVIKNAFPMEEEYDRFDLIDMED